MTEQNNSGVNVAAEVVNGRVVISQPQESAKSEEIKDVTEQEQPQKENELKESESEDSGELEKETAEHDGLEDDEKPKKKKGGFVKKLEAKDAEIEFWKQEALKKANESSSKPKEETVIDSGKPKLEDFETYDEYQEAVTDWKVEQKLTAKEVERKKAEVLDNFQKQTKEVKKVYNDFDEVVSNLDGKVSKEFFDASLQSDKAAEIAYYVGKNFDEVSNILISKDIGQINRFLGKLETKLEMSKSQPSENKAPVKVTNAPPPINPLKGKVTITKDYGKMSADEYFREVVLKRNQK